MRWLIAAALADLLLVHGRIHTEDPARTIAQAVAIRGNSIVAVGTDAALEPYRGASTKRVDLRNRVVLPGIIDAHVHPAMSAQDVGKCSLDDKPTTLSLLRSAVRACMQRRRPKAGEWQQIVMINPVGTAFALADLDAVFGQRPAFLTSADGHTGWSNSAGLAAAGISAATPDPAGGHILRDTSGAPNGTLHDTAMDLVQQAIPPSSIEAEAAATAEVLAAMRASGITSVQDASADEHLMRIYRYLYDSHRLKMRLRASLHLQDLAAQPATVLAQAQAFRHRWTLDAEHFRADAVKIFADGGIEYPAHTASLLEPYLDSEGHPTTDRGPPYFDQANLNAIVAMVDAADFTVHVHAIGDRAVRSALDAVEYAHTRNGFRDNRHQIAHLELVDPHDFARFKALGVIANFQLQWAIRDTYTVEATMPYIGPQRARFLYPARSLRDAGALLVGGSDWGVSTFNAFEAMEHAITRAANVRSEPLFAEESLTLEDMVAAYTINAAYARKQETFTGSVEVGKRADLIVLDRNIFAIAAAQLHATRVVATYLDGKLVYRRPMNARSPTF